MSISIGINGFGRIGRLIARALHEYAIEDIQLMAINSPASIEISTHLLRFDSVHGTFNGEISVDANRVHFDHHSVHMCHEKDPVNIPWGDMGVDIVLECTGLFRSRASVQAHLESGAQQVLISAPAQEVDKTIVYGVNTDTLEGHDRIISCASCTTNCLAPLAKVLMDTVGIRRGFTTTVHAYTQDQRILDNSHTDLYRARAAAMNMIPTSTGAAKTVGLVIPALEGRLSGSAVRVPTANVSMLDLAFQPEQQTTAKTLNTAISDACRTHMRGIIDYTDQALVSSDFNHNPHSAIFAAPLTKVLDGDLVKIVAWYDNEWGFANRMIDVARAMGQVWTGR